MFKLLFLIKVKQKTLIRYKMVEATSQQLLLSIL